MTSSNPIIKHGLILLLILFVNLNAGSKKVQGIIIDLSTNRPIADVAVTLTSTSNTIKGIRISDSTGYFGFNNIVIDTFYLRTDRAGYVNINEGPFDISHRDSINFLIKLEEQAYLLNEVVILDKQVDRFLDETGFYDRKESLEGKFFTRKEIREKSFHNVISLMRTVPGMIIRSNNDGAYNVYSSRSPGTSIFGGTSEPLIYIDGVLVDSYMFPFLDMFNIENIAAIEIYNSSLSAPMQYSQGQTGGVILIWTGGD